MCEIDSEGCVIVKKPWVTKGFCCNKLAKCSVFHNDECMMSIKFNASKNLTFYILLTDFAFKSLNMQQNQICLSSNCESQSSILTLRR